MHELPSLFLKFGFMPLYFSERLTPSCSPAECCWTWAGIAFNSWLTKIFKDSTQIRICFKQANTYNKQASKQNLLYLNFNTKLCLNSASYLKEIQGIMKPMKLSWN